MDRVRWFTKLFFWNIDPFLKIAKNRAKAVLPINTSVIKMMNLSKDKTYIIPAVGSEPVNQDFQKNENAFNILSIGRFVPLKGFDITIKAFTKFYKQLSQAEQATTKLRLVGKGGYEKALREMIGAYQMENGIEIISWVERAELKTIYEQAHLFFFPSHEGAGMVVPEAFSYRVPVLCFDNYGPGEFVTKESGIAFPYSTYENSINEFATALMDLFRNRERLKAFENGALERYESYFDWEMKGRQIAEIYEEL
jgi:glycosyltransferase involved in cell wall biosynthesis